MIDLDRLTTVEAAAYAAGLRDALAQLDRDLKGERRAHGVLGPGRKIHARARTAQEIAETGETGLVAPERIRQSTIASFNRCPLSTKFELQASDRLRQVSWLGAHGVLFHIFAARAVSEMMEHGEGQIGVDQAMELLREVVAQRDVPDEDVVHVPMRELRWLRVMVTRWAYRHTFSVDRVVAIEERLDAEIEVVGRGGRTYWRKLTGKPDLLISGPALDEATVVDWKSGFAPPANQTDDDAPRAQSDDDRLSDMGYVQQIVYGILVMLTYPVIQRVHLREWYVFHDEVREATVERWQMERVLDVLSAVMSQIDGAIEAGPHSKRWFPVPGSHCAFCIRPRDCPIRDVVAMPTSLAEAQRTGREWLVAAAIRKERLPYLKGWVDRHGPIPIAHAKGRREIGWKQNSTGNGRRFVMSEPDVMDDSPFDEQLAEAARRRGVLIDG